MHSNNGSRYSSAILSSIQLLDYFLPFEYQASGIQIYFSDPVCSFSHSTNLMFHMNSHLDYNEVKFHEIVHPKKSLNFTNIILRLYHHLQLFWNEHTHALSLFLSSPATQILFSLSLSLSLFLSFFLSFIIPLSPTLKFS